MVLGSPIFCLCEGDIKLTECLFDVGYCALGFVLGVFLPTFFGGEGEGERERQLNSFCTFALASSALFDTFAGLGAFVML